ncbi:Structural maintenance of chromosomes protein 2-2 [Camellia lanceoleosa]|uniref:Structural maintenance of chromosomes protein 2-2 n=1 Tax=Camellia lanceoleosa TaxID=1840588 RepID=A0ACC0IZD3_9ERIC|nr:Structural maintenance of chromosomes protein 2-2 [Camellia lanceoleosa]
MAILQKGSTELEMVQKSRLKGLVAELVKLKDSLTMIALEAILNFQVVKGNAEVALSWVVAYDEELKNAMEFAFGSTFICQTIDVVREDGLWSTSMPVSRNLTCQAHKRGFTKCIHHSFCFYTSE